MIRLKVREIAIEKGISQTRLGQLAFIDVPRMQRIWKYGDSEHTNLTLIVLERLARALEVEPGELLEMVDDPPPG